MKAAARALYEAPEEEPSDSELAAFGFLPEDYAAEPKEAEETIEIWADNWVPVQAFLVLRTQWRTGPAGISGLDYGAIPTAWRLAGIRKSEWPECFGALRVLEHEVLEMTAERFKAATQTP